MRARKWGEVERMGDRRAVTVFLAGTLAWSWGLLALFAALGGTAESKTFFLFLLPYMLGPGIAALLVQAFVVKRPVMDAVGLTLEGPTWLMASWLLPPIIALSVLALASMWPGMQVSFSPAELLARDAAMIPPEHLEQARNDSAATSTLVVFFSQFAGAMLFGNLMLGFVWLWQEIGWRGFLLKHLAGLGFWRASLVAGLVSAVWYAPMAFFSGAYPDNPAQGTLIMGAFFLLVSPLACWLRLRAGSVLAGTILVGGLHAFSRLVFFFTIGGDDLTRGLFTLPGLIVMAIACAALAVKKAPGAEEAMRNLAHPTP